MSHVCLRKQGSNFKMDVGYNNNHNMNIILYFMITIVCVDGNYNIYRQACAGNRFACLNDRGSVVLCIPLSWVCDGENDCVYGTDEQGCTTTLSSIISASARRTPAYCYWFQFRCDKYHCILRSLQCNGITDCLDATDEVGCTTKASATRTPAYCYWFQFRCDRYHCILRSLRCNGFSDCPDAADEVGCTTSTSKASIIPTPLNCNLDEFRCDSSQCVPASSRCNGVTDCLNAADELTCSAIPDGSSRIHFSQLAALLSLPLVAIVLICAGVCYWVKKRKGFRRRADNPHLHHAEPCIGTECLPDAPPDYETSIRCPQSPPDGVVNCYTA